MKEIKIKTPYGEKNWSYVKRVFDTHDELLNKSMILLNKIENMDDLWFLSDEVDELKSVIKKCGVK